MNPPVQDNPSDADEPSATPVDEQPAGSPSAESTSDSSNGPKPLGLWRGALVTVLALVMGGVAYSAIMKLKAKPKRHKAMRWKDVPAFYADLKVRNAMAANALLNTF